MKAQHLILYAFLAAVVGGVVGGLLVRGAFVSPYGGMGMAPPPMALPPPPMANSNEKKDCEYKITFNGEAKSYKEKSVTHMQCMDELQKKVAEHCKDGGKKGPKALTAELAFGDEKPMPFPAMCPP
jgi:hypothetical protein